jgi:acyl-CoA reductase-like NAD-dependent aldehyde dehydrogenase
VFQVLPGEGPVVGHRFVTNEKVAKVCFTGSTRVGTSLMAACAPQVKRVTLELGGKSANIVFADSDLDVAAATAPYGVFDNAGQDCCARSRILVEASVFDAFLERFLPAVAGVVVGDPSKPETEMGPLITAAHHQRVSSFLDGGDEVLYRGTVPTGDGFFFPPTVLLASSPTSRVVTEEIFGPVVVVQRFTDEAEAIALANATVYGLSGSIWTNNLGRAIRVARGVDAGNLSVNSHSSVRYATPFGGMKQSGLGRELGPDAIRAFTETKNVFLATEG